MERARAWRGMGVGGRISSVPRCRADPASHVPSARARKGQCADHRLGQRRLRSLFCAAPRFLCHIVFLATPTHEAGLPPSPLWPAAYCACVEGSRFSAVIGLCRTFEETSGRHCRWGRLICQRVSLSPPGGSPDGARRVSCVGWHS